MYRLIPIVFFSFLFGNSTLSAQSSPRLKIYLDAMLDRNLTVDVSESNPNLAIGLVDYEIRNTIGIGFQFADSERFFWELTGRFMASNTLLYNGQDLTFPDTKSIGRLRSVFPALAITRFRKLRENERTMSCLGLALNVETAQMRFEADPSTMHPNQNHWNAGVAFQLEYRHIHRPSRRLRTEFGFAISPYSVRYEYSNIEGNYSNGFFNMDALQTARLFVALSFGLKKDRSPEE